jgi:hypothetical protein
MKEKLILAIIVGTFDLLIFLGVMLIWYEDCKEIGKNNLAVSLKERIIIYITFVILPSFIPFVD